MPSRRLPLLSVDASKDVRKLVDLIVSFPNRLFPLMRDNVKETFSAMKSRMEQRTATGPLYRRTGRLTRSWTAKEHGYSLRTFGMATGSYGSYSYLHEVGGVFTPKPPAKYFWIPLGPNVKANRTAKVSPTKALELIRQKLWRFARNTRGSADIAITGKANMVLNELNQPTYVLVKYHRLQPVLQFKAISDVIVRRTVERLYILSGELARKGIASL